jgi:hypothetical protein
MDTVLEHEHYYVCYYSYCLRALPLRNLIKVRDEFSIYRFNCRDYFFSPVTDEVVDPTATESAVNKSYF